MGHVASIVRSDDIEPLIRKAIAHNQFESMHPSNDELARVIENGDEMIYSGYCGDEIDLESNKPLISKKDDTLAAAK